MKRCPCCAEEIQDEAIKCRFCRAEVIASSLPGSPAVWARAAGPHVSSMAIASLVSGLVWFYWVGSILALIFGYLAKAEIDRQPRMVTGRGLAVAGIVLGWIEIAGGVALVGAALIFYLKSRQH